MSVTAYHNSPARSCENGIHRREAMSGLSEYDTCKRFHTFCQYAVKENWAGNQMCGRDLSEWRPIPPTPSPRSLRQWIYDKFFA